ncbi:MAG: ABC transporter permease [Holosporales bacterium]
MTTLIKNAYRDLRAAFMNFDQWAYMGVQDIVLRYQRTRLGPIWVAVTMGATILGMGVVSASLFNTALSDTYPHLATGFLGWAFISSIVNESTNVFVAATGYLQNLNISPASFSLRLVVRNFMIYLHNLPLVLLILLYLGRLWDVSLVGLGAALLIVCVNAVAVSLWLGMICARYRDLGQAVQTLMNMVFFITPIMWPVKNLGERAYLAEMNPMTYFVELMRAPLLGSFPSTDYMIVIAGLTFLNIIVAFMSYAAYRRKLIFWL